jgi:hypothetical protein
MKLPRDLDGRRLVKTLCRDWNYEEINQEGSHIFSRRLRLNINAYRYRITILFESVP